MSELFSINGAADLLERDRATLVRALRHVPPDGFVQGQPRWHMEAITTALAMTPQERRETGKYRHRFRMGRSKTLDRLLMEFEKKVAAIKAEPDKFQRRALTAALAPLIGEYQRKYLEVGRSLGIAGEDVLGTRADLSIQEMVADVAEAAGLAANGAFFAEMIEAMEPHTSEET